VIVRYRIMVVNYPRVRPDVNTSRRWQVTCSHHSSTVCHLLIYFWPRPEGDNQRKQHRSKFYVFLL